MSDGVGLDKSAGDGGYRPDAPLQMVPLFKWPLQPIALAKWLFGFPGYLWPWQAIFVGFAVLTWFLLTPDASKTKVFAPDWVASIFFRNVALIIAVAGVCHVWLYVLKRQGADYKYNTRELSADNPTFLFRDQVWDNVFWTLCSAVPIWTAYEVLMLWSQANGFAPTVSWRERPVYCILLFLLPSVWHSIYFYTTHRIIHWRPLYRSVHSLHHKNVNIGPWSGLAMHPVEHLIFFSEIMLYWLIPAHPIHVILHLQLLAVGAVLGHTGFDRLLLGKKASLAGDYMHYLHHKHVRVNFGDQLVPCDKWFGTLHDGSNQAQEELKRRARARALRARTS